MPRAGGRGERGYTLVEFVAALALVGILLTLAVFQVRQALAREQIDDWARSVAIDIEFGRQSAVTRRTTVTITLTATGYTVATSGGLTLSREKLPSDISLSASCGGTSCSSFSFDRRGLPITAQSPPPPPDTVTLTSASTGKTYVVTIQSLTGRVSYQ